jgi:CoA:oxalate CoA-transferase
MLEGIRVLDHTAFINGSSATSMLGALGAEVIYIEDPVRGSPSRGLQSVNGRRTWINGVNATFESTNRNKKSMTLDLYSERGQAILHELLARSDLFVTNYSARVVEKLGLTYEVLREYNPRLVYATTSGFGPKGPHVGRRVFDPIAQARSGLMYQMGDRDTDGPAYVTGTVADQTSSLMLGWGMLAGLLIRERTGVGQKVETSMLATLMFAQASNINTMLAGARPMVRHSRSRTTNPFDNVYRCGDGAWLLLGEPQSPRFWGAFCAALELQHLEHDERFRDPEARRQHSRELIALFNETFARKPRAEWVELLDQVGLAFEVVNAVDDLPDDPQVLANDYITTIDHPVLGDLKTLAFPLTLSESSPRLTRAPEWGEHTEEILLEVLGYDWDQIGELRNARVI